MFRTTNSRNSYLIQRAVLVLMLLVVAHSIRPITVSRVSRHLLRSAQMLSFILPGQAVSSLYQADYLAMILDTGSDRSDSQRLMDASEGLMAQLQVVETGQQPLTVQPVCPSRMQKSSRQSGEASRPIRKPLLKVVPVVPLAKTEPRPAAELVAEAESAEQDSGEEGREQPAGLQPVIMLPHAQTFSDTPLSVHTGSIVLPDAVRKASEAVNKCLPEILKQDIRETMEESKPESATSYDPGLAEQVPIITKISDQRGHSVIFARFGASLSRREIERLQLLKKKAALLSKC
jgi:hypothetical protein